MQNGHHHDVATADRLRADIDRGKGADKVDHPDPATVPLGTDDEAAGRPPKPERVRMARREEIQPGKDAERGTQFREGRGEQTWLILLMAAVVSAVAAAAVIAAVG
jgi:hypothetical protein